MEMRETYLDYVGVAPRLVKPPTALVRPPTALVKPPTRPPPPLSGVAAALATVAARVVEDESSLSTKEKERHRE